MQFVGQLNSVPSWKFNRFSLVWAASVLRPLSNSWMQTVPALWPHRCSWKNGAALDAQIQCISRQEWMDFMMGPQGTRSDAASCFFLRSKKNQLSSNFQDLEVCAVYLQAMQMRRMWRSAFSSLTRPAYWNESDSAKSKAAAVPAGCLTMFPVCPDLPWFGLAPWPGLFWPIDKSETQPWCTSLSTTFQKGFRTFAEFLGGVSWLESTRIFKGYWSSMCFLWANCIQLLRSELTANANWLL